MWRSRATLAAVAFAVWNPWTADWLIGSSRWHPWWARLGVFAPAVIVTIFCVASAWRPQSRILTRLAAAVLSLALLAPLACEALIRFAVRNDVKGLRDPGLYCDPHADDDYWKLMYLWNEPVRTRVHGHGKVDPRLGWSVHTAPWNPLGIIPCGRYEPVQDDVALFFGDSFVGGTADVPVMDGLPCRLDRDLPERTVYNYGVGGYGVGQSYLRFEDNHTKFRRPLILFGVLDHDLDRTILSVRGAPKPRFEVEDGELRVKNVPLGDRAAWYEDNPVELRSYFIAFVARKVRWAAVGGRWAESDYRLQDKLEVNRLLLEEVVRTCESADLPLLFVRFVDPRYLVEAGWRGEFLCGLFEELGVPWVDTQALLNEALEDPRTAYGEDRHLNELGNEIVAREMAKRIRAELLGAQDDGESR